MQRRLRLTLELDPDSEPIRGTVTDQGAQRSFTGWMQLVTAMQAAVDNAATRSISARGQTAADER
jgi:hypothetical protein